HDSGGALQTVAIELDAYFGELAGRIAALLLRRFRGERLALLYPELVAHDLDMRGLDEAFFLGEIARDRPVTVRRIAESVLERRRPDGLARAVEIEQLQAEGLRIEIRHEGADLDELRDVFAAHRHHVADRQDGLTLATGVRPGQVELAQLIEEF